MWEIVICYNNLSFELSKVLKENGGTALWIWGHRFILDFSQLIPLSWRQISVVPSRQGTFWWVGATAVFRQLSGLSWLKSGLKRWTLVIRTDNIWFGNRRNVTKCFVTTFSNLLVVIYFMLFSTKTTLSPQPRKYMKEVNINVHI